MNKKLNLGCGEDIREGFINLDYINYKGVDVVFDLTTIKDGLKLPFENNYFDEIICYDVLEHISDILELLKEIDRVCKVNGIISIKVPLGKWVWDNLDHKRQFNLNSFTVYQFPSKNDLKVIYKKKYILPTRNIFSSIGKRIFGKINLHIKFMKINTKPIKIVNLEVNSK